MLVNGGSVILRLIGLMTPYPKSHGLRYLIPILEPHQLRYYYLSRYQSKSLGGAHPWQMKAKTWFRPNRVLMQR